MNAENKYRLMFWSIVILALMNLATIGTMIYNRKQTAEASGAGLKTPLQNETIASVKFSGRYFRDQLGLSTAQMTGFTQFNPRFRQNAMHINMKLSSIRNRMLTELAVENSDTAKLYMLSDSIGLLHAELKKLTCRYYMDFKNICNDSQKEKLEQLFGEMFAADLKSGQYGRRGPGGMGRGRRLNNN